MSIPTKVLSVLRPYFEGNSPGADGEVGMFCPLHEDDIRSSSLNMDTELWYCQTCEIGMSAYELVDVMEMEPDRVYPPSSPNTRRFDPNKRKQSKSAVMPDEGAVAGWCSALLADRPLLKKFQRRRGISIETLRRFQIGWDRSTRAFTIPVRDRNGDLINVRRYQLDPTDARRKIWSVAGHGSHALYPVSQLEDDPLDIIICEGEWDCLLLIQHGFHAITRTGTADAWSAAWNNLFKDKVVYLLHDMDVKGQKANKQLVRDLADIAKVVAPVKLPYPIEPKHGKDVTDFFLAGGTHEHMRDLLVEALPNSDKEDGPEVNVLESFSSDLAGKTVGLRVTVTGKRNPPYLLPRVVNLSCTQNAGNKCNICPMMQLNGEYNGCEVKPTDPIILAMAGADNNKIKDLVREDLGIQKCGQLTMDTVEHQAVEELYIRPAIDRHSHDPSAGDYTTRKIFSVGRHDTTPNQTVKIKGAIYPNPRTQHNELQAWEVDPTETLVEAYEVTERGVGLMESFQTHDPLPKLSQISRDLARCVTRIYGRPHMHAVMDLVWHSVLAFPFDGVLQTKGWLEALILGDTRTGKSEAAQRLMKFYAAGDMVSCESASYAGIVGGLQQMGGGKEWEITWGAIPINDRRLVALDEVSGLDTEQIAQMSDIRSSGVASLTKIRSEKTYARTRLLWLSNPRDGGQMVNFTHGVQAIRPLIGNNEDIARFDLAMTVRADEVESTFINKKRDPTKNRRQTYTMEACRELVQWVWSRKPEHVVWEDGAEALVYDQAVVMGGNYIETPPLIQAANVRFKIARVAVALAARLFSTDSAHQLVVVKKEHVMAAVKFIDAIYGLENFGYKEASEEFFKDQADAVRRWGEARQWLAEQPELVKFLRSTEGRFRNNDIQDMLNVDREMASAITNTLWRYRLIHRQGANILINPILNDMLKEIKRGYESNNG